MSSKRLSLALFSFAHLFSTQPSMATESCELYHVSRSELKQVEQGHSEIQNLGKGINLAIKKSFDVLNTIDHATFGLVSAFLLGDLSLENIQPVEWNKAKLVGALVFQDQPFSLTPLRGVKMTVSDGRKKWNLSTGTQGEFSLHLFELVSYKRIRLFPHLIVENGTRYKESISVPVTLTIDSKLCHATLKMNEIPFEPITLIATKSVHEN